MERKLKERLVGAALLVLAAALVIPLFLDGPAPEETTERSTVALPPAADSDTRTRTVRLEQSRDTPTVPPQAEEPASPAETLQPAPVAELPVEPQGGAATSASAASTPVQAPAPAAAQTAPASTPAPVPAPAPSERAPAAVAPAEAGSNWVVQLGSFGSRDNAERLATELREKRYQSFVTRMDSDGRTLHRVRVGPAGTRDEADRLLQRLRADGYSGQPVPE